MKRLTALFLPVFAIAWAGAQKGITFHSPNGGLALVSGAGIINQDAGSRIHFNLGRGVVASSQRQGLTIRAPIVTGEAVPAKSGAGSGGALGGDFRIQHALATGGVVVVKATPTGGTTLASNRADYTDQGSEATVVLTGGVRITGSEKSKAQTMVITGSSGRAVLDPGQKGSAANGLRTATVEGNVRVQVDQASAGSGPGHIVATGRKLVLDERTTPATLTLTGGVKIQGGGKLGMGTMQVERALMRLSSKFEVISTEVSS